MTKECSKMQRSWIAFESNVNPKSIAIPISDPPRDIDGDILAYGLMASSRPPFTVYASFLDPQGDESDLNMLKGAGQLRYVDERYVFSTLEKLESPNSNGTKIDIRPSTCDLKGSGRFELPLDFQLVEQSFVGSFEINSRGEYIFKGKAPRTGRDAAESGDFELEQYIHLRLLNDGILMTPFHNMALMCPDTTAADVDAHTKAFRAMCAELVKP